jgi:hypothetical protein
MISSSLRADEPAGAKKVVMTIASAMDTGKSDTLEKVLNESMHVALEVAGFRWTTPGVGWSASAAWPEDGEPSEWSDLYDQGAEESVDLILAAYYQLDGSSVSIDFQLHDVEERKQTFSLKADGKFDLTFDKIVAEAVEEIVARSGVSPTHPYTAADAGGEDQAEPVAVAATPKENGAGPSPSDASPGESEPKPAISTPAVDVGEPGIEPAKEPPQIEKIRRLELSAGFAPFLTVGGASEYFRFGLIPSLYANYRIPVGSGYLAVGIFSGANYFRASGIIATSDSLLIPVGLDFRLAPIGGTRLSLFLRLSGGPAMLILNPNKTGALTKVVPYALGGIGINLAISRWFGFTLDSSFSFFYEQSLPIMGYTPSVYLFIRI